MSFSWRHRLIVTLVVTVLCAAIYLFYFGVYTHDSTLSSLRSSSSSSSSSSSCAPLLSPPPSLPLALELPPDIPFVFPSSPSSSTNSTSSSSSVKPYFVSVLAIFRNEVVLLDEWVRHYIRLGVSHIYLIDHGPSTDASRELLRTHRQRGYVELLTYTDRTEGAQLRAYNSMVAVVKRTSEWVIVCDIDEFLVVRHPSFAYNASDVSRVKQAPSLPLVLSSPRFASSSAIIAADLFFGGSGHIAQPLTVLCNFIKRANYDSDEKQVHFMPSLTKYLVRTDYIHRLGVHVVETIDEEPQTQSLRTTGYADASIHVPSRFEDRITVSESLIESAYIVFYHFRILSEEWYINVRAKRGNVLMGAAGNTEAEARKERNDYDAHYNAVTDETLKLQTPYCNTASASETGEK